MNIDKPHAPYAKYTLSKEDEALLGTFRIADQSLNKRSFLTTIINRYDESRELSAVNNVFTFCPRCVGISKVFTPTIFRSS